MASKDNKKNLNGKKVAILIADGVEEIELTEPRQALLDAGAKTDLISLKTGKVKAWDKSDWGQQFDVDLPIDQAQPQDYDALLIPGGTKSPDKLRMNQRVVQFVRSMFDAGKPVASICHGPWLLAEADVVRGRKLTSYPSIQTDLRNAGAQWVDQQVVTDNGLVTSRKPDDLPAFNAKMIEEFCEGKHDRQQAGAHAHR